MSEDVKISNLPHSKHHLTIPVYWYLDEEVGYILDTDEIQREFEKKLGEIEDDLSELNHIRDEHLKTKHMEG